MKGHLALVALLLACSVPTGQGHPFTVCGGVSDQLTVSAVTLNPDPPQAGENLGVNLTGGPTEVAVTGGNTTAEIILFGHTLYTLHYSTCKDFGVACPLSKGSKWDGGLVYPIPSICPAGVEATVKITISDGSSVLSCVSVDVTVAKKGQVVDEKIIEDFRRRLDDGEMQLN
jgi:hypothetical protein